MTRLSWFGTALLLTVGCGSKESIALSAIVRNVDLAVEQKTLGTALTGSFELQLELGAEASGSTQVSIEAFALVRGADTLVSPLAATPVGATFPVSLGKGQKKTIAFQVGDADLLEPSVKDALCAGALRLRGAVSDTLANEKTPLQSADVTLSGC